MATHNCQEGPGIFSTYKHAVGYPDGVLPRLFVV
jgi:hypothetical protein